MTERKMKMSGQQITNPEINSVHSVKILLCYIMEKLNRPVTREQLRIISEDSGIINYFFFSDALEELIENQSVEVAADSSDRKYILTEKGRLGSEYFNSTISLVFRRQLLKAAFSFFVRMENENMCSVDISESEDGCSVRFKMDDGCHELVDMSFYAPDRDQAELISEKIKSNPTAAYKKILGCLLDNEPEEVKIEKYL